MIFMLRSGEGRCGAGSWPGVGTRIEVKYMWGDNMMSEVRAQTEQECYPCMHSGSSL